MSRKPQRRRSFAIPSMYSRIEQLPVFDYLSLVDRRRYGRPGLPAFSPVEPRELEPQERRVSLPSGPSLCYSAWCAGCGQGLISAVGPIRPGTLCSDRCPRTLTPPA